MLWWNFFKESYCTQKGLLVLSLMLVGMFFNISVEALKWQYLVRTTSPVSFRLALTAVFSGITAGLITPHGIGDYVGRILFLNPENRLENIASVLFSRIAQLCITCIAGVVATLYFCFVIQMNQHMLTALLLAIATLLIIFLVWKFRVFLLDKMKHVPLLKNIEKWFDQLRGYSNQLFIKTLALSALRYGIFLTQFVILLIFFGVELPLEIIILGAVFTFFVKSIVPTFFDLGVRELAAVFFFSAYHIEDANVLAASISLWLINLLIPAVVGLFCMFGIDYTKK
ncbi:lysylphosphatidylglycerol synthase transmembrane domain-containing protein [Cytophaga aurantiaca]|uniref:lysylphosphatidylglycerol synthase transmembrane domain-containing protein n=1 Tax=Cytophaga aurantiaca TaxID=29530 RepID=UPI001FDFE6A0|nr:lysylphosphatidylglycerol synthase domain-containing protein [Cytophaga aurantiaca]